MNGPRNNLRLTEGSEDNVSHMHGYHDGLHGDGKVANELLLLLIGTNKEEKEELTSDFTTAAEAIVAATHAGDVIFAAFFEL